MDDIYKNIEEFNPNKKCKILIIFNDMISDMVSNKKLNLIAIDSSTYGQTGHWKSRLLLLICIFQ